jgi:folate-binding protein YgfZ
MDSPLLNEPGAVAATGPDAGVTAHYGDPYAEQRALAGAFGLVDRSHRGVVQITGPDRLGWLHSLATVDVEHLPTGQATEALILSPTGHVEHHLSLADDGTSTWVHTEPGAAEALVAFLESMRFMLRVEVTDATASHAVLTLMGPAASPGELDEVQATLPLPWGTDLIVSRPGLPGAVTALRARGAVLAGTWAHEALRIEAGRPRFGLDTDARTIPHEAGWIDNAVHLNKGCYRGQETVARVHNLGHPPRRLVRLLLDGSEDRLPGHGDEVLAAGTAAGFLGSAARHYELGPVALAVIKRTIPAELALEVAGIAAAQEVVVAPDAGGVAQDVVRRARSELSRPRE